LAVSSGRGDYRLLAVDETRSRASTRDIGDTLTVSRAFQEKYPRSDASFPFDRPRNSPNITLGFLDAFAEETVVTDPRKSKPPNKLRSDSDRLTATIWPPKVEGTGHGVRFAFWLALVLCALTLANVLIFALRG
jgi:hypothetical protein